MIPVVENDATAVFLVPNHALSFDWTGVPVDNVHAAANGYCNHFSIAS